ncbi:MAG TPA: hypothetical protein VF503_19515 [Sphingobium sp.]
MHRNADASRKQLVDLGSIVTETKGGAQNSTDSQQMQQPESFRLSDD